jgi:hypothetical protein
VENYFGLVYCRIIPPRKFYHPVLPYHAKGKLLFPLCASCAYTSQETCNHSEAERCTWVSLEINVAIENGYKNEKIYEIWHWSVVEKSILPFKQEVYLQQTSIVCSKSNKKLLVILHGFSLKTIKTATLESIMEEKPFY